MSETEAPAPEPEQPTEEQSDDAVDPSVPATSAPADDDEAQEE